jgi:parvulin-like peptidyl-prolyl isomerase
MKFAAIFLIASSLITWAQPTPFEAPKTPGALSPDTVIATIDGKKLTYGDVQAYLRGLPPQMQQNAMRNRKQFIQQFALMQHLSELSEKAKLAEKSPYKEAIAINRMNVLSQAQINERYTSFPVHLEEQQKFYDENKGRFDQVKLKVIYIPFSANPSDSSGGKKPLSEQQAKENAEQLVKEIKGGADFVKLVKDNSEDATSKAKDGDFGAVSRSDNLPEPIRTTVFALKAGEVSNPVRQPNGFYIFRAEEISAKPFGEVKDQIYNELKNVRLKEWIDARTKELNIKFEDNEFFSGTGMPSPATNPPNK